MCCLGFDILLRLVGAVHLVAFSAVFAATCWQHPTSLPNSLLAGVVGVDPRIFRNLCNASVHHEMDPAAVLFPVTQQVHFLTDLPSDLKPWLSCFFLACAVTATFLLLASATRQRWLTVPWLATSVALMACQAGTAFFYLMGDLPYDHLWQLALALLHVLLTVYCVMAVVAAHYFWLCEATEDPVQSFSQPEEWENIFRSPPQYRSPYKQCV